MKNYFAMSLILLTLFAQASYSQPISAPPNQPIIVKAVNPNRIILPENYRVYVLGKTVLARPAPGPNPGFTAKTLATYNFYKGAPGCYIACYSHQAQNSAFPVSNTIFVHGQIRVPGHYRNQTCQPARYVNSDISKAAYFKFICQKYIRSCQGNDCWAGGNTGSWVGIHSLQ